MDTQITKALNWRYATKVFDSTKKIDESTLNILTEALRLSPSSYGLQPWKFYIVTNPKVREELKAAAWGQAQITDASHLVVLTYRNDISDEYMEKYVQNIAQARNITLESLDGLKNMVSGSVKSKSSDAVKTWNAKQTYIALGILLESAALLEVDACPMEGFDNAAFDKILKLDGYSSAVICALGYRSKEDILGNVAKARFDKSDVVVEVK